MWSEEGYDASRASFKCNSGERRTKGQRTRCRVADCAHSAVGVDVGVATLAARAFVAATQTWNMTGAEQRGEGGGRNGDGGSHAKHCQVKKIQATKTERNEHAM